MQAKRISLLLLLMALLSCAVRGWRAFVLPDKNEFREGPHTACCAYARSNTVPFAAMLSMTGVTALCSP